MRYDDIGLFWEDIPIERTRGQRTYQVQPIPQTSWRPIKDYPNLSGAKIISFDTETKDPGIAEKKGPGWATGYGHVVGFSVSVDNNAWYFPIRHELQPELNMDPHNSLRWLNDTLKTNIPKVGANLLYDYGWLLHEGVSIGGMLYDVQFAQALINETTPVNLDYLGELYCSVGKESNELYEWCALSYGGTANGKQRANIYRAPTGLSALYAQQDALLPFKVLQQQWRNLEVLGLVELFEMECKLIPLLYKMRMKGVRVDIEKAHLLHNQITQKLEQGYAELSDLAGQPLDSVSNSEALMDAVENCGIILPRTVTGRRSLTKPWMKAQNHPVVLKITALRDLVKIRDVFIDSYILGTSVNDRIHCQFHSMRDDANGTISGRFSSSAPNLQNIPKRSSLGKEIRKIFVPDYGEQWRRYDYSQVEYRMLAHFAVGDGSDEIRNIYNHNPKADFHNTTGDLITKFANLTLEREPVKTINFGLTYGMGFDALYNDLKSHNPKLTKQQAKALVQAYHQGVPFSRQTLNYYMNMAQQTGQVKTVMGRITHFDLWEPIRSRGEKPLPFEQAVFEYGTQLQRAKTYKALNAVLQGSAADLMKKAMLICMEEGIFEQTGYPSLTVHDELDFSDGVYDETIWNKVRYVMENAIPLSIPFLAEPEIGPNWGETKEIV